MLFIALGGLLPLELPDDGIRVDVGAVGDVTEAREACPVVPSSDRLAARVETLELFPRMLLPNVDLVAVAGVSVLRSLTTLPVSDIAEGGLDPPMLGVPKIEDSRR